MRKLKNEELDRKTVEEFKSSNKIPLLIILDDVRSLNNIGSVFRTADAFLVEKIYLCGITAQPPHKDIQKTALGATETVSWEYRKEILPLIKELQQKEVKIYAVEQAENAIMLHNFSVEKNSTYALVFGNEVKGVQQQVINSANGVVEVPQFGTKHSLNVSVCTGICIWDLYIKIAQT